MQKALKWTPAQPFKKSDNIISSKARETGDYGFTPSYLLEPKEDMNFLMSNEYMRIWFKERGKYEKGTYSKEAIIKEESKIKRRFVQRMMTYKKPNKNQFLEKKLNQSSQKSGNKMEDDTYIDYSKMKYKPQCLKQKEKGTNQNIQIKNRKIPAKVAKKVETIKNQTEANTADGKTDPKNLIVCEVNPVCYCAPTLPCGCTSVTYGND